MKRLLKKTALIIGMMISTTMAIGQVNVQVNIGSQPDWGPVGYERVSYYYLPDIDTYYSIERRKYVYLQGSKWVWVSQLPAHHRHYNLYSGYKVVLTDSHPFKYHHDHKIKYKKYKNYHGHQKANKYYKGGSPNVIHHNGGKSNGNGGHLDVKSKGHINSPAKNNGGQGGGNKGGGNKGGGNKGKGGKGGGKK